SDSYLVTALKVPSARMVTSNSATTGRSSTGDLVACLTTVHVPTNSRSWSEQDESGPMLTIKAAKTTRVSI
ncbi:MAG: hypothetical protein ACR2MF_01245, partial [Chthoniobacterales bacterium]